FLFKSLKMKCVHCKSLCIKKGFQKNGKQKYRCSDCRKYQQANYTYKAYEVDLNAHITKLVNRSCGIRDIAYIKDISTTTVMRRILSIANKVTAPSSFPLFGDYEMDEMHTYIRKDNRKTETYIAYAINKQTKQVVNFTVGSRSAETLAQTVDKILLNYPKSIRTDKWSAYPCIIPEKIHICTRRKINQIERYNYTLRTHLKRLGYNRLCQSKTVEMLVACLKIYFWS
ncbi:MAG TPA: IS1 family transposase, partial [Emticicia sp.]